MGKKKKTNIYQSRKCMDFSFRLCFVLMALEIGTLSFTIKVIFFYFPSALLPLLFSSSSSSSSSLPSLLSCLYSKEKKSFKKIYLQPLIIIMTFYKVYYNIIYTVYTVYSLYILYICT